MLDRIFTDHLTDLQNALSRTTQRQAMLTENLANVNVPNYKRKDMDFHVQLTNQLGSSPMALQATPVSDNSSLRQDGNNVDIEREVTGISETDLHYQALTSIVSDYFSGLKSAIKEGK
jgi:flagellar basal-body rod protein FlgB